MKHQTSSFYYNLHYFSWTHDWLLWSPRQRANTKICRCTTVQKQPKSGLLELGAGPRNSESDLNQSKSQSRLCYCGLASGRWETLRNYKFFVNSMFFIPSEVSSLGNFRLLCLGFCFIGGARLDGFDVSFRTRTSSHTRRCHHGNVIPWLIPVKNERKSTILGIASRSAPVRSAIRHHCDNTMCLSVAFCTRALSSDPYRLRSSRPKHPTNK